MKEEDSLSCVTLWRALLAALLQRADAAGTNTDRYFIRSLPRLFFLFAPSSSSPDPPSSDLDDVKIHI